MRIDVSLSVVTGRDVLRVAAGKRRLPSTNRNLARRQSVPPRSQHQLHAALGALGAMPIVAVTRPHHVAVAHGCDVPTSPDAGRDAHLVPVAPVVDHRISCRLNRHNPLRFKMERAPSVPSRYKPRSTQSKASGRFRHAFFPIEKGISRNGTLEIA
jgi:hypothetical protein